MNFTFHKWVLNVRAVPNPTQTTKLDKYNVQTQKSEIVQNTITNNYLYMFRYFCLCLPTGCVGCQKLVPPSSLWSLGHSASCGSASEAL